MPKLVCTYLVRACVPWEQGSSDLPYIFGVHGEFMVVYTFNRDRIYSCINQTLDILNILVSYSDITNTLLCLVAIFHLNRYLNMWLEYVFYTVLLVNKKTTRYLFHCPMHYIF